MEETYVKYNGKRCYAEKKILRRPFISYAHLFPLFSYQKHVGLYYTNITWAYYLLYPILLVFLLF